MNSPIRRRRRGFTLIEILAATAVLLIIMVFLLQVTSEVGNIWKAGAGKISGFQNARSAFSTINRTLSRAALNSYNDYVDAAGKYRNINSLSTFVPAKFERASELHFITGPADKLVPGATAVDNPGDAIFFQAPLGYSDDGTLKSLNQTVNSIGFYVDYGTPDDSLVPAWLQPLMGTTKRFRLIQFVEPTEKLEVYKATANPTYDLGWLDSFKAANASVRARVLAEDVSLLVVRPRLSPNDESTMAPRLGATYSAVTKGSILSPNYHYDSRAWQTGYPSGERVGAAGAFAARSAAMRNQLPPIVDVVMVCLDRRSLARLDFSGNTPPSVLQVPATLFQDSSRLDADLEAYAKQLSDGGIRYKIFRTSTELQGARWSVN